MFSALCCSAFLASACCKNVLNTKVQHIKSAGMQFKGGVKDKNGKEESHQTSRCKERTLKNQRKKRNGLFILIEQDWKPTLQLLLSVTAIEI